MRAIANERGLPWSRTGIQQVLTNEKYVGNNVYNRVSFKLKQKRVANPPNMWVRTAGAFEAIVDVESFRSAREIIEDRSRHFTDEELLTHLKGVLAKRGALSSLIIDETDHKASSAVYRVRFGSLVRAYRLVGYVPARDYTYIETNRALRTVYADVVADTITQIEGVGGTVQQDGRARPGLDLRVHDPLGRKGQHLAHEVAVGLLLNQLKQRHSVIGRHTKGEDTSPSVSRGVAW